VHKTFWHSLLAMQQQARVLAQLVWLVQQQ
jgi:hypothetical protein